MGHCIWFHSGLILWSSFPCPVQPKDSKLRHVWSGYFDQRTLTSDANSQKLFFSAQVSDVALSKIMRQQQAGWEVDRPQSLAWPAQGDEATSRRSKEIQGAGALTVVHFFRGSLTAHRTFRRSSSRPRGEMQKSNLHACCTEECYFIYFMVWQARGVPWNLRHLFSLPVLFGWIRYCRPLPVKPHDWNTFGLETRRHMQPAWACSFISPCLSLFLTPKRKTSTWWMSTLAGCCWESSMSLCLEALWHADPFPGQRIWGWWCNCLYIVQ